MASVDSACCQSRASWRSVEAVCTNVGPTSSILPRPSSPVTPPSSLLPSPLYFFSSPASSSLPFSSPTSTSTTTTAATVVLCFLLLKYSTKAAQFRTQHASKASPKSILEPTWWVEKSVQAAFGLLAASWSALGALRSRKNIRGNGSWTARAHRGDRFQHAWGPNGCPKGVPGGS